MNKTKTPTVDKVTFPLRLPPKMYKQIKVSLPAVQTATDNGCKGDANVTFDMKKITGILLTFGYTSDSGTITKITYTKK